MPETASNHGAATEAMVDVPKVTRTFHRGRLAAGVEDGAIVTGRPEAAGVGA